MGGGTPPHHGRMMSPAFPWCRNLSSSARSFRQGSEKLPVRLAPTVSSFSWTCPNGETGRRVRFAGACPQGRVDLNSTSGTAAHELTRQAVELHLSEPAKRTSVLADNKARETNTGPRALCRIGFHHRHRDWRSDAHGIADGSLPERCHRWVPHVAINRDRARCHRTDRQDVYGS